MQAAACAFHAEREALGVCVVCRSRVCAECTTKVEGINYCVRCLAHRAQAEAAPERSQRPASRLSLGMSAITWAVVLWLAIWALLELAFPEAV